MLVLVISPIVHLFTPLTRPPDIGPPVYKLTQIKYLTHLTNNPMTVMWDFMVRVYKKET